MPKDWTSARWLIQMYCFIFPNFASQIVEVWYIMWEQYISLPKYIMLGCVCVCALIEDDLWRKISTAFAYWRPRICYCFHFCLQNRPVFLPDPLLCNTEPRQLTRGADIVSLRSSFNALVQSVHHIFWDTTAKHLTFPLKQSTEHHPSNLED